MRTKTKSLSETIIIAVLGAVIFLLVLPLILMLIWNAVITGMFGLPSLGYWSAIGLYVVCNILFGITK
jgi:hypothetical protein